jgi:DNA-binding Xre family transcriptional regulator
VALHDLYYDRSKRIDYETLDRVCRVLAIDVGELLQRVPASVPSAAKPRDE